MVSSGSPSSFIWAVAISPGPGVGLHGAMQPRPPAHPPVFLAFLSSRLCVHVCAAGSGALAEVQMPLALGVSAETTNQVPFLGAPFCVSSSGSICVCRDVQRFLSVCRLATLQASSTRTRLHLSARCPRDVLCTPGIERLIWNWEYGVHVLLAPRAV